MHSPEQNEQIVLEGLISIEAALHARSREISRILLRVDKNDPAISRLEREAARLSIPISRVDAEEIDKAASGTTHGGIVALAGPRRFMALADMVKSLTPNPSPTLREREAMVTPTIGTTKWFAMIDGVEDPYNFGAAVRSLYAAGASGLIVRPRNWFTAAGVVARASAGASERIATAIAETVEEAADLFKAAGFAVACADESPDATSLYDADLTGPLFMLIGGEKRGVTRSFRDRADLTLRIPYGAPAAHSLGTASATAVIAFEILRQRWANGDARPTAPPARPSRPPLLKGRPDRRRR